MFIIQHMKANMTTIKFFNHEISENEFDHVQANQSNSFLKHVLSKVVKSWMSDAECCMQNDFIQWHDKQNQEPYLAVL